MNDDGHDIDLEPTDTIKKSRIKKVKNNHIIILAKNETGLRNLYKLVTISHLRYLHKRPMLPREVIEEYREGLILGSACEAGELYRAILAGRPDEELEKIASFYDYLEIQPTGNNMFLVRQERCTVKQLQEHNRKIYELGKKLGKLTVATCDVHFCIRRTRSCGLSCRLGKIILMLISKHLFISGQQKKCSRNLSILVKKLLMSCV